MEEDTGLDERVNQGLDQLESLADYVMLEEYPKDTSGGDYRKERGGRSASEEGETRSPQGNYYRGAGSRGDDSRDREGKLRYAPRREEYRDFYHKRRGYSPRGGGGDSRRWYGEQSSQRRYERSPPRYEKRDSGGYKHRDEAYRPSRRSPSPPPQAPPPPRFPKSPEQSRPHQTWPQPSQSAMSQPYYTQPPPPPPPPPPPAQTMAYPQTSHLQAPTPPHIRGHDNWSRSRSRSRSREWARRGRNGDHRSRSRGDSYSPPPRRGQKYGQSRRSSSSSSSSSASSDSSAEAEKKAPAKKKRRKRERSSPTGDDDEERANLMKQREVYMQKLSVLEQQEGLLSKQLADLRRSSDNNPTLLQENLRLQTEIKSKARAIRDVVNRVNAALGDPLLEERAPTPVPEPIEEKPPVSAAPPPKLNAPSAAAPPASQSPVRDSNATWLIPTKVEFHDSGQHWCRICNVFPLTVKSLLNHYMSEGHRLQMLEKKVDEHPWHQRQAREPCPEDQEAVAQPGMEKREALRGCQFFVPVRGWYCKLCDVWMGDHHCAGMHLHSQRHNDNYNRYLESRPDWEERYWSERAQALEALDNEKEGGNKALQKQNTAQATLQQAKNEPAPLDPLPEKEFKNPPKRNQEEEDAWSRSIRVQMRNKRWKESPPSKSENKWLPMDSEKDSRREESEERPKHRRHHHHRHANKSDEEEPGSPSERKRKDKSRTRHGSGGKDRGASKRPNPPAPKYDTSRSRVKLPFIGRMPVLRTLGRKGDKQELSPTKEAKHGDQKAVTPPPTQPQKANVQPAPQPPPPPPKPIQNPPPLPQPPPRAALPQPQPQPQPQPIQLPQPQPMPQTQPVHHYMMYPQPVFPQPMAEYSAPQVAPQVAPHVAPHIPPPLPPKVEPPPLPPVPPKKVLSAEEIEEMRMLGIDVNDAAAQALSMH